MGMTKEQTWLQFFVLQLTCCCLVVCLDIRNITITQPLRDHETIGSLSQTFKLGFFGHANSSNRYLGIMFNISVPTVIWGANRDKPLTDSSGTLAISGDGNLVLLNGRKEILWSSNVSDFVGNATANLQENGNLVLEDSSNGRCIWQSFKFLTDSQVRGMKLRAASGTKEKLTSWSSPSDPSVGNFTLGLHVQSTAEIFIWNGNKPYWRSGPWGGNTFIGIPEMESRYGNGYNLAEAGSEAPYFSFSHSNDILGYYHLTHAGTLPGMCWEANNNSWKEKWSSRRSPCDLYGYCGPFGVCNPRDSTICKCLRGFEPKDKEEWHKGNWTGGCTRKASLLQCGNNISAGKDGFLERTNIKVPDFAKLVHARGENCRSSCLENCSCIAYSYYKGVGCLHWSDSLIDLQQFSEDGADLFIRVAHSGPGNKKRKFAAVFLTLVVGFMFIASSAYISWKYFAKHTGNKQDAIMFTFEAGNPMEKISTKKLKQATLEKLPLYSYEVLAYATDNFNTANKLGKGGFGEVYKGKLFDGQEIAVKRLSRSSGQGIEEFMNEVVVISKLQHRNLVRLIGCCVEREEKMLIYEHMPNGSLDAYLFYSSKRDLLDWRKRALILEGIGRGLLYLHRDSRSKIIHRDLKASNILLDGELGPKISDFGLARIFGGNQDEADTRRVVGTYGYMAPEYAMKGIFSEKSDVFSFGVLLLEIVSERTNSSFSDDENALSLLNYAWKLWNEGEAVKLIDSSICHPSIETEILRYIHVGLLCVQEFAKDRPNVFAILSMLNSEILELPRPKLPAFTGSLISSGTEFPQGSVYSINNVAVTTLEAR